MMSRKMNPIEKKAVFSIATIMSLRMIGLFMVTPIFALYAQTLPGATPALIGIAMGIYGFSQAFFQLPFGLFSDRFGRKPIIFIGLIIFGIGSFIAYLAHSIAILILGRILQGTGAIGSTALAMIADLTREEQRTKSMAIVGMTIGFSFSIAMILGPLLTKWFSFNVLFLIAAIFSLIGIFCLFYFVPSSKNQMAKNENSIKMLFAVLKDKDLMNLNFGIFILHAIFTASFIVIPIHLLTLMQTPASQQWLYYSPTLLLGFIFSFICINLAERKRQIKNYFTGAIISLILAQFFFLLLPTSRYNFCIGLTLFFSGFSLLEAFLPSLISRTVAPSRKGSAMGVYSSAQFLGIFVGGLIGGLAYGQFSLAGVYFFSIIFAFIWLIVAFFMQPPRYYVTQILKLFPDQHDGEKIIQQLRLIPGVREATLLAEDSLIYVKMEQASEQHPDFLRFKEHLQSNN